MESMVFEVLRIGQRLVRDDRVTTHVALVARAFGASKIYMNEVNPQIKDTLNKINQTWGGGFEIEFIDNYMHVIQSKKKDSVKIVHLTMYGENINDVQNKLQNEEKILIVVGAEKVPRNVYEIADYNVAIGSQPHSEISALAVVLDRIHNGTQFMKKFENPLREVIPTKKGKNVVIRKKMDK
jgi:tRNA (cytidine56-2'-O)-methyltransferase